LEAAQVRDTTPPMANKPAATRRKRDGVIISLRVPSAAGQAMLEPWG
jgi:hypothetical protein